MRGFTFLLMLGVLAAAGVGQEPQGFAAPERIAAGGDLFKDVLYPSPTLFDVDGDGVRELLVGDLMGNVWVSEPDGKGWAKRSKLEADGKPLRLNNW